MTGWSSLNRGRRPPGRAVRNQPAIQNVVESRHARLRPHCFSFSVLPRTRQIMSGGSGWPGRINAGSTTNLSQWSQSRLLFPGAPAALPLGRVAWHNALRRAPTWQESRSSSRPITPEKIRVAFALWGSS